MNTPFASVKAAGPSKVRVGVDESVEVAVRDGSAAVEGTGRKAVLRSGDYLDIPDADAAYQVSALPDPDSWDRWNDSRDLQLADADSAQYLPSNIALVSGDLGDYGSWRDDPQYGHVWCPRVTDADWRPYQHGHWVWVEPFGWTWVSTSPGAGRRTTTAPGWRRPTAGPGCPARRTSTGALRWLISPSTMGMWPGARSRPPRSTTRRP